MDANDPRHGKSAGYVAGCRQECCRTAIADYTRHLRTRQYLEGPLMVDGTGTRRRIRALVALGWSLPAVDARLGKRRTYTARLLLDSGPVLKRTADRVAAVFEAMSMTLPPQSTRYERQVATRSRNYAAKMGWPPPLAWDDIDDPTEQPQGVRTPKRRDLLAEWHDLRDAGESIEQAAVRLGVTVGAIERAEFRRKAAA